MDRSEKLRLSAGHEYGYCFKQGMFVRLYEQSLYRFSFAIKALKPVLERVKGGDIQARIQKAKSFVRLVWGIFFGVGNGAGKEKEATGILAAPP